MVGVRLPRLIRRRAPRSSTICAPTSVCARHHARPSSRHGDLDRVTTGIDGGSALPIRTSSRLIRAVPHGTGDAYRAATSFGDFVLRLEEDSSEVPESERSKITLRLDPSLLPKGKK